MDVFVTGGTGFVGNNLVRLLIEQGHQVKALVQPDVDISISFEGILDRIAIVRGDMTAVEGFADALVGSEVVIHMAAFFTEYYAPGDHRDKLHEVNVVGTMNLLNAAERGGVRRFVYVSTAGVNGIVLSDLPSAESAPPAWYTEKNAYSLSKLEAERRIDEFSRTSGISCVVLRPSVVIGPRDVTPTNNGEFIITLAQGSLPAVPDGAIYMVDARDVAQALSLAMSKGNSGDHFLLAGHHVPVRELASYIMASPYATMKRMPMLLPQGLMLTMARVMNTFYRLSGKPGRLDENDIRFVFTDPKWNSDKAERELGVTFRPIRDSVLDELEWFHSQGKL